MTPEERKPMIESYGKAYDLLINALQEFPQEMWQFRPATDRWTIHEILVHIADSEVNSYVRSRRLITDPGGTIQGYDENRWATDLHYQEQDTETALELFRILRLSTYLLIQKVPDPVWAHTGIHSEDGQITLEDWLRTYERHVPDHIEQMRMNFQAWSQER
jgi:hypothetical protein